MNAAAFRNLARSLSFVEETEWDDKLVYWVGDKAIGGKVFALLRLELTDTSSRLAPRVLSLSVGLDRYHELLEHEGIAHHAHALTYAKLGKQTKALLAQPAPIYRQAIAERRLLLQTKRKR